jgi:crotonobetainyl-CoA:carnitine CoA-transferase CaiB-like acyl-CoA transferase
MQPLRGIRVLDLSRLLPGPFATLILGDLGAHVDKVEDLAGGDPLRYVPPLVGDQSALFLALNRNKRSACLDLKKPTGQRAFLQMVEHYDVVLEQFRPGVLERLGLSHATMRVRNPRLVICALTGHGQTGPLAGRAGHDLNYLARAGVLGMQNLAAEASPEPPPPPRPFAFQLADMGGALWSALAILAALRERDLTGSGQVLDVAMVEASMGFAFAAFARLLAGELPTRGSDPLAGGIANYGSYLTKDGQVMTLGALEPKFWATFCAGVGLRVEASGDMLHLPHLPGAHQAELKDKLRAIFALRTRAEWEAFSREYDCCLEPMLQPAELRSDEQLKERGVFFELDSAWGRLAQMATPVTSRGATHAPPPRYGEHTETILREAGMQSGDIEAMRADGAIR